MGLADTIRAAVATANAITGDLQVVVKHSAWVGVDGFSKPSFAKAVERPALVEFNQRMVRQVNGQEVLQVARVMFLEPIHPNGADGRREPIDPRDKIVLPNGFVGPILEVSGFVDSGTDRPFFYEVALGRFD